MSEYLMNELRHTIEQQGKAIADLEAANADLTARCARLAAALEWYATKANYTRKWVERTKSDHVFSKAEQDQGSRARSALTADDRALAERWRAMEEEHRTCQEWLNFIEAHENDADADCESCFGKREEADEADEIAPPPADDDSEL